MALKNCKECGNEVSTASDICPHCGVRVKRKPIGCIGGLFILIVIGFFASQISEWKNGYAERRENAKRMGIENQKQKQQQAVRTKFVSDIDAHQKELAKYIGEKQYDKALAKADQFAIYGEAGYGDVEKYRKIARTSILKDQVKTIPSSDIETNLNIYRELLTLNPDNIEYLKKVNVYQKKWEQHTDELAKRTYRETCDLAVLSGSWSVEYDYAIYEGQVKNVSTSAMKNVQAVVTWYDQNGQMITSSDALIQYNPILPGQTSPFKVMHTHNPAMEKAGVEFSYLMGGKINSYSEK